MLRNFRRDFLGHFGAGKKKKAGQKLEDGFLCGVLLGCWGHSKRKGELLSLVGVVGEGGL